MKPSPATDYAALFLHGTPLLDVRAPVEFQRGAFPCATNLPLMDDAERAAVGTCYTEQGQEAAIALGHQLVCGERKQARIAAWQQFAEQHPEGRLYCFRGGLRSQITQQWLREAGVDYDYIPGGYKTMRRFLLDNLTAQCTPGKQSLRLLSGRTGCGKTRVLQQIHHAIDLEGRANHRGSAFGRLPGGQPSQINFENALSIDFLKLAQHAPAAIYIEDESRLVGRCYVPDVLQAAMHPAGRVVVEASAEQRTQLTLEDYVLNYWPRLQVAYGERAAEHFSEQFLGSILRIKKRLGDERYRYLHGLFQAAIEAFLQHGDAEGFRAGFHLLLTEYYDPMYDYMLSKRQGDILFRGSAEEVVAFANHS